MHLKLFMLGCATLVAGGPGQLLGQTPPAPSSRRVTVGPDTARAPVEGVVYDSLADSPLAGATVQIVNAADAGTGAVAALPTGADGRFRFPPMRAGRYLVTFFHPVLDSLGIDAPTRAFDVLAGRVARVELAVPSGVTLLHAFCRQRPPGDSSGALVGFVRDGESGLPVPSADVVATWRETVIDAHGFRTTRPVVGAKSAAGGFYVLCGIPPGLAVTSRASTADRATAFIAVAVARDGITKRDFNLPSATVAAARRPGGGMTGRATTPGARGTARLAGLVRGASGSPLAGARVDLVGSGDSAVTNESGAFALDNLPSGTQNVEVRFVGYAPKRIPVDLAPRRTTTVAVRLDATTPLLDPVRVTAKTSLRRALDEFDRQRRGGLGYYVTRADIDARHPLRPTDLFTTIPGVRIAPTGTGSDYEIVMNRGTYGACQPTIYLDKMRFEPGSVDINTVVHPDEILGVAVYTGGTTMPAEYGLNNSCGAVVIWTHPLATRAAASPN